jgi:high-affinity iron transporter
MLAASLITLREGLEAALIIGIVLGYVHKIGRSDQQRVIWLGTFLAIVASVALAALLQVIGATLEGTAEQLFEGATMLLAVGVLTWMIFWMRYQARYLRRNLERKIERAIARNQAFGLASLSFIAVFREGVETALFLSAAIFAANRGETIAGGLAGLGLAILVGWLLYSSTRKLDIRPFFDVTSVLLLLFAAGLFAHGLHEFAEAGLLPSLVEEVWNTKNILSDTSVLGSILRSLVGYNDNPSLLEVVGYLGYWVVVLTSIRWWTGWLDRRLNPRLA